ncbi:MAG: hypothetical protein HKL90_12235 [Elusimicrobia bacterium]|nr:hypothetical protein [Elusimicrobiota bacterium]
MGQARRSVWTLGLCAALGAAALSAPRMPLDGRSHAVLIAEAELHPALAGDALVRATLASPYTHAACALGRGLAGLQRRAGISVDVSAPALLLALWVACAGALFSLALNATGSPAAAAVATLWFGLQAPLTPGAVPYGLTALDRSLGLLPLLFAIDACLSGRRNRALGFLIVATYLHGNPAIHLWPWILVEDGWAALKRPAARRGAVLRLLAAAAAGLPLLAAAGRSPLSETDAAHAQASLASFGPYISGRGLAPTDLLFGAMGLTLIGLALRRADGWKARPALLRGLGLALGVLAVGTMAGAVGPRMPLWGVIVKYQPWVALYVVDLIGLLVLSRDLALALQERRPLAPAYAWTLALAAPRDLAARALGLAFSTGLEGGPVERAVRAAALAAVAVAAAAATFPAAARAAASSIGLRGGFLSLPSFQWAGAAGLAAALALGHALRTSRARNAPWAGLAVGATLFAASVALWPGAHEDAGLRRLEAWARAHLPPDAVVYHAPIQSPDCTIWMARSRRRMTPCVEDIDGPMLYFSAAPEMGARLRAGGYDPDAATDFRSHMAEMGRTLERATPERAARLAAESGVTDVLIPSGKAWPGTPLATAGRWSLYAVGKNP